MSHRFQAQTYVTAFEIGFNIFFKAQTIIFLVNKLFHFIDFKIVYQKIVIISANKFCLNNF